MTMAYDELGRLVIDGYSESGKVYLNDFELISENGVVAIVQATDYFAWKYCAKTEIQNPPPVEAQAKITIVYDSDMNSDFSDLRFSTLDRVNIPYWIESKTDGVEAFVWLKVPGNNNRVICYYGNYSANDASDAESVFEYFHDMDDDSSITNTGGQFTDGICELDYDNEIVSNEYECGLGLIVEANCMADEQDSKFVQIETSSQNDRIAIQNSDNPTYGGADNDFDSYTVVSTKDGVSNYQLVNTTTDFRNDYNVFGVGRNNDATKVRYLLNSEVIGTETNTAYIPDENFRLKSSVWNSSQLSTMQVDWWRIRVYLETEPTLSLMTKDFNPYYMGYTWNAMKHFGSIDIGDAPTFDAQVEIDVTHLTGMNSDFSDVRFATDDDINIEYWRESYTDEITAKYWIRLPPNTTRIKMYYGNTDAQYTGDKVDFLVEDFDGGLDGWTVVDPNSRFLSGSELTITALSRNEEAYIYKELPVDRDFTFQYSFKVTGGNSTGQIVLPSVSTELGDMSSWGNGHMSLRAYPISYRNAIFKDDVDNFSDDSASLSSAVRYWVTSTKVGNTLTTYVYTDENRTALVDTISVTISGVPDANYLYLVSSNNTGSDNSLSGIVYGDFKLRDYATSEPTITFNPMGYNTGYYIYDWSEFEHQSTIVIEDIPEKHAPFKFQFTKADHSLNTDLSDLRCCDADGNYLPVWVEENDATVAAWTICPANATRIFMRCGKLSVSSESNGWGIFTHIEEFDNSDNITIIQNDDSSASLSDGKLTVTAGTNRRAWVRTNQTFGSDQRIIVKAKRIENIEIAFGWDGTTEAVNNQLSYGYWLLQQSWSTNVFSLREVDGYSDYDYLEGTAQPAAGVWSTIDIRQTPTNIKVYVDEVLDINKTLARPAKTGYIGVSGREQPTLSDVSEYDWIVVLPITEAGPTGHVLPEGYSPDYIIPDPTLTTVPNRATLTIGNHHTSRYPLKVTITHETGMQNDFSDIWFRDELKQRCPHWIESFDSGVSADVMLLVPTAGNIHMYYGDGTVENVSNGEQVFIMYDSFTGNGGTTPNADKFDILTYNAVDVTSELDGTGNLKLSLVDNKSGNVSLVTKIPFDIGIECIVKSKSSNLFYENLLLGTDNSGLYGEQGVQGAGNKWHSSLGNGIQFRVQQGDTAVSSGLYSTYVGATQSNLQNALAAPFPVVDTMTTHKIAWFDNGVIVYRDTTKIIDYSNKVLADKQYFAISKGGYSSRINQERFVDWVGIREYVENEPTVSVGAGSANPLYSTGETPSMNAIMFGANF